ncbi:MAG TPA: DNA translocase FtsK 4TM domain-containing protein, partial [Bacteroidia bacterium]|nr:DNA translocase FtsK 4TM domain-containing protein [Bacteroidia bacterium]
MARKEKEAPIRNTLREQVDPEENTSPEAEAPVEKKEKAPKTEKNKLNEKKEKPPVREAEPAAPRNNPITRTLSAIRENERLHKVTGAFLLFIVTPYLLVAFTSYLFNWQNDQNKVGLGMSLLFDPTIEVGNLLGKFGALVAHAFIHRGFGVTSYLLAFLSFVAGLRILFQIQLISLLKVLKFTAIFMVLGSVVLGYLFSDSFFVPGGAFGFEVSTWLNSALGKIGTGFLLGFSILTWLIIVFNFSFNWFVAKPVAAEEEIPEPELIRPVNTLATEKTESPEIIPVAKPMQEDPRHDIELSNEEEESILWEDDKEETPEPEEETETVLPVVPPASTITVDESFQVTVKKNEDTLSPEEIAQQNAVKEFGEYDPTLELGSYQFPPIDLLESYGGSKEINVNTEELTANKDRILKTLGDYGIEIDKIKATIGPTVTLYEIIPKAGVRIAKIKNLEDDIALSLSALGIRIIAPIPGKGTIGIEVPNLNPEIVPMRSILASEKFQSSAMDLPVALGKTISNETFITDLAKMPHLLMAGATGQGKSVGLNALLVSLLYKKHPSQIKFVLVDPKKVELTLFNKIERHFLAALPDSAEPIITDTKKVVHTLNSLCIEMDNRYDLLKDAQVRNIKEYNAKFILRKLNPNNGHKFLPYIVVVIDEFADLIMTAGKEVETPIARIAQLARAIGIHLIIATQRPSVNIITGTIKANFPARIAFRVTSKIDSRTILDAG